MAYGGPKPMKYLCEYDDCTAEVTIDCADCWPWMGLCDAHHAEHGAEHRAEDVEAEIEAWRWRDAEYAD